MATKEFESHHGAALIKVLRQRQSGAVTLRLVETERDRWSTYTLNDEVDLFITHRNKPRPYERDGGGVSWTFQFSPNQTQQLRPEKSDRPVWAALICVLGDNSASEICLLEPEQLEGILRSSSSSPSVTIRKPKKGWFQVMQGHRVAYKVPLSALDKWEVPGA